MHPRRNRPGLVDERLDAVQRSDLSLIDHSETEHVGLVDGEAPRTLHGDDIRHVSELTVIATRPEDHQTSDARRPALESTGRPCGRRPLPCVPAPVHVAQGRDVPRARTPWIVVKPRAEREGTKRIAEDVGCTGAGRRSRCCSSGFLLATYLRDLRAYALELRQERGGPALQCRRLLAIRA